jgi:hypothetical protein
VYPFTSIKENLVEWSRRQRAADGDAEGGAYTGPPFLRHSLHAHAHATRLLLVVAAALASGCSL